jgi:hypothetical protein
MTVAKEPSPARIKNLGSVNERRDELTLQLPGAAVRLSTKEVEGVILDFAGFRALMLPLVSEAARQGEQVPMIPDPAWSLVPSIEGTQLHIFYPGLGWLYFALSRDQVEKWTAAFNAATSKQPPLPPSSVQ